MEEDKESQQSEDESSDKAPGDSKQQRYVENAIESARSQKSQQRSLVERSFTMLSSQGAGLLSKDISVANQLNHANTVTGAALNMLNDFYESL